MAFDHWPPPPERIRAQGIMWMRARWGGARTPYLLSRVLGVSSWRAAFLLFGLLGVGWAVVLAWWFRDNPANHKLVNAAARGQCGRPFQCPLDKTDPLRFLVAPVRTIFCVQLFLVFLRHLVST